MAQNEYAQAQTAQSRAWSAGEKYLFRTAFIFFIICCIPLNIEWYKTALGINIFDLHYRDLYDIARFNPSFVRKWFDIKVDRWGFQAFIDWLFILGFALVAATFWSVLDRGRKEYNQLYYWLRVIVRYRAAVGIIAFGFTKFFPTQMPYPSESLLNNNFGDLTGHKIFWLSISIVPWFQVFTGVAEILAGTLLFFRRTTFIGAALLVGTLGTIMVVNLAYDGGVHVYAGYFVLLGTFLMVYDFRNLYRLFIQEKFTVPVHYYPALDKPWQKYGRLVLKTAVIVIFLPVLFYYQGINFLYDPYKQPAVSGIRELRGFYNVTEFKINGRELPYSPLDTVRWQEVIFEKWTSMSYKVNKPVSLDLSNGGGDPMRDIDRTFEVSGVAGGRRVFHYQADTVHHILYLRDKNTASIRGAKAAFEEGAGKQKQKPEDNWIPETSLRYIKDEATAIHPLAISDRRIKEYKRLGEEDYLRPKMKLQYSTQDGNRVILTGYNEYNETLYIVLDKVDRKYAVSESSLSAGRYD